MWKIHDFTIIASFENVEIERMEGILTSFRSLTISVKLKEIVQSVCFIHWLTNLFMQVICLETPFRWSDHSSVFRSPNRMKYFRRLFDKEGKGTVDRILQENPIYQNQGHDQMRFVDLLLDAWPGTFRMIEIIRDPVDLIDAWKGVTGEHVVPPNGFNTMH